MLTCEHAECAPASTFCRFMLLSVAATSSPQVELFRDDFSKLPPGWLSKPVGLLNGAIQEYHYLPHRGVSDVSVVQPDHA